MSEPLELGGNIVLSGFGDIDGSSMIIVKKMVGNYAKKFSEVANNFESLHVTVKPVHKVENSSKFELHAKLIANGKPIVSEATDKNLFVVLDTVLKKVESLVIE